MLVCLTSARRPRYREDVTRALALPKGGIVQFRYGENIVDPSTKERICGGSMAGETVVVCFIH